MPKSDRHIEREEEWYRIYSSPSHPRIYESKFASGEAAISISDLKSRWKQWQEGERVQFAQAFGHKRTLVGEDEEILDLLIAQDDEKISASIALLSTKHSDRKRAARFLTHCLKSFPHNRSNFLQALSVLAAPETTPDLLAVYEECHAKVADNSHDYESLTDLLYCSAALFKILHDARYRDEIARYLQHPNEAIRTTATLCLV